MSKKLSFIFCLLAISFNNLYSQPNSTVSLTGGYSFPLGVLNAQFGSVRDTSPPTTNSKYYVTYGYNYGVNYKLGIGKKRIFRITGALNFTIMGQSKNFPDATVKLRQNILSFGLGGEWNLAPKRSWFNPFAGAEFDFNFFGGNFTATTQTTTYTFTMNSTIRYGFAFGGGVDILFHQSVGAIVGVKYYMTNLFGKDYGSSTSTTYSLDDGTHVSDGVNYPDRTINVFQIYGGFSYYFGR